MMMALAVSMPGTAQPDVPAHRIEVVGGVRAAEGEFPWVVRLSNGCAGTLIRSQYVLTAAHCVGRTGRTSSIGVTAGSADLYSSKAFDVRSSAVTRAPGFSSVVEGDDWAVVRLSREVDLPVVDLPEDSSLDNGTFTVVGWGATSENSPAQQRWLRKVQVPYVSDASCGHVYDGEGYGFVAADMLCAGDTHNGGKDSCQGDSGGPLLRRDQNRWVQVGIVSWGVGCAQAEFPGVYTQVSHFLDKINGALEQTAIEQTSFRH
jgi:secreted trypsin-like serine protease